MNKTAKQRTVILITICLYLAGAGRLWAYNPWPTGAAGSPNANAITVQGPATGGSPVPVADTQGAAFQGAVAMTAGTTYAAQRSVGVLATASGNVVFQFPDASTLTLPVYVGWQTLPFACTEIVSAGTTATATYYNLK